MSMCDWCDGLGCEECEVVITGEKIVNGKEEAEQNVTICDWCDGSGKMDGDECTECDGTGKDVQSASVENVESKTDWDDMKELDEDSEMMEPTSLKRTFSYTFMQPDSVQQRKDEMEITIAQQLDVTLEEAKVMLRAFSWNPSKTKEEWFEDAEQVRKKYRVYPPLEKKGLPKTVQCMTDFCDEVPIGDAEALGCGHWFCKDCWTGHIEAQVSKGMESVYSTCPGFCCKSKKCKHRLEDECKCVVLIPEELMLRYLSEKSKAKYVGWMNERFTEHNKFLQWCPTPQCDVVVEYNESGDKDISCKCGHKYCFKCSLDAHQPVPCDLAKSFLALDQSDMLTQNLLEAMTKPCPKCKVRIEKNGQCVHMTCRKCRHDFCWLCKKDWKNHGGNHYSCDVYNKQKAKGEVSEEQKSIHLNQKMLQKYNYYREEYNKQQKSVSQCIDKLKAVEAFAEPIAKKGFLIDALDTLASAFRLLQWSYCLSYFLADGKEKNLFLHQQKTLLGLAKEQSDRICLGTVPALCELQTRMVIINKAKTLEKCRKSTLKSLEDGQLVEVLMNKADAKNDNWACNVCKKTNELKDDYCTGCRACALHGERECYGCKPR